MSQPRKSGATILDPREMEDLPVIERLWRRLPFVERHSGEISITRVIALYFALLVGHIVEETHVVTWSVFWLAVTVAAIAFGKSTFSFFLTRVGLNADKTGQPSSEAAS